MDLEIWNTPPNVCAMECTIPRETLVNAIPAAMDACSMISLAFISVPSAQAFGRFSIISIAACVARISEI